MTLPFKFILYLVGFFTLYCSIKGLKNEKLYFFNVSSFRWEEKIFRKGKETILLNVVTLIFALILIFGALRG